jgi:hypothetical protein
MTKKLLLIAVVIALYLEDVEGMRERFWASYDRTVNLVLDELELWGVVKSKNYSV